MEIPSQVILIVEGYTIWHEQELSCFMPNSNWFVNQSRGSLVDELLSARNRGFIEFLDSVGAK